MKLKTKRSYKPIVTILVVSVILTTGYMVYRRTFTPQPVGINEIASNGTVALYASPTTVLIRPNAEKTMAISYVADTDKVTAVKVGINYDPSTVTITGFTNAADFPTVFKSPTQSSGLIEATYGVAPESGGKTGSGTVAWFRLKTLHPGTSTINFSESTIASTTGLEANALKEVHNSTIQTLYPGDINGDNVVDIYDYTKFVTFFNDATLYNSNLADFNNDTHIDIYDYTQFVTNFGKTYP